jgi:hypothetical protein
MKSILKELSLEDNLGKLNSINELFSLSVLKNANLVVSY